MVTICFQQFCLSNIVPKIHILPVNGLEGPPQTSKIPHHDSQALKSSWSVLVRSTDIGSLGSRAGTCSYGAKAIITLQHTPSQHVKPATWDHSASPCISTPGGAQSAGGMPCRSPNPLRAKNALRKPVWPHQVKMNICNQLIGCTHSF